MIYGYRSNVSGNGDSGWLQSPRIAGPGHLSLNLGSFVAKKNVSHPIVSHVC